MTTDDHPYDDDRVIRLPTQQLDQIDLDLADKDVHSTTATTHTVDTNSLFARVRSDLGLVLGRQASGRFQRGVVSRRLFVFVYVWLVIPALPPSVSSPLLFLVPPHVFSSLSSSIRFSMLLNQNTQTQRPSLFTAHISIQ